MSSNPPIDHARRNRLRLAVGLGLGLAGGGLSARPAPTNLHWHETLLLAFGNRIWLRAAHRHAEVAARGVAAAAEAVLRVERQMSLFRDDSALCALNRDRRLTDPPAELLDALRLACSMAARSGGLFDPTVQPLWALWRRESLAGRRPTEGQLRQARALVDWTGVSITDRRITLARDGMAITLNGIAQGFAADLAARALRGEGIEHALIDTGEWLPLGRSMDHGPWRLGVADPRHNEGIVAALQSDGRALACSSDDKLAFSADKRDHHILDPRSARSPTQLASVVVAAPSAALADALTKPMFMGSIADALRLARRWRVDVLAVSKDGRWSASPGLKTT